MSEQVRSLDPETKKAEQADAEAEPHADRPPTADEERAAERAGGADPEVADHFEEMMEKGAEHPGEGRVEL